MSKETQVATKTSTKTSVALFLTAGALIAAAALAMTTGPNNPFYKKGQLVSPGYSTQGYTAPGYGTQGYSTPGYVTPGYVPGYVTSGYVAPGYQP